MRSGPESTQVEGDPMSDTVTTETPVEAVEAETPVEAEAPVAPATEPKPKPSEKFQRAVEALEAEADTDPVLIEASAEIEAATTDELSAQRRKAEALVRVRDFYKALGPEKGHRERWYVWCAARHGIERGMVDRYVAALEFWRKVEKVPALSEAMTGKVLPVTHAAKFVAVEPDHAAAAIADLGPRPTLKDVDAALDIHVPSRALKVQQAKAEAEAEKVRKAEAETAARDAIVAATVEKFGAEYKVLTDQAVEAIGNGKDPYKVLDLVAEAITRWASNLNQGLAIEVLPKVQAKVQATRK